jgi:hypothetical protein
VGPATNVSQIPSLARLLGEAGWEPTPELSGVFKVGSLFLDDGQTHRLMVRDCFEGIEGADTYTSAEVVSQLVAGVRVNAGMGRLSVEGGITKKVTFGAPVHHTLERLAMHPTPACVAMLHGVKEEEIEGMYAIQELLTAEIAEQTCGRIDASGSFVGLGSGEAELAKACSQKSLEPVAVAYRTVPLADLTRAPATLPVLTVPHSATEVGPCPWGEITSVATTMTSVSLNGQRLPIRGEQHRMEVMEALQRCGEHEAARLFQRWRTARRTTNIAAGSLVGCYPAGVCVVAGVVAGRNRQLFEDELRP